MAKKPKHLRKKTKEIARTEADSEKSKERPGSTGRDMMGPPIVKQMSGWLTDLAAGKITWQGALFLLVFLGGMIGAAIVVFAGF